jgi:hypothetical protein
MLGNSHGYTSRAPAAFLFGDQKFRENGENEGEAAHDLRLYFDESKFFRGRRRAFLATVQPFKV